MQTAEKGKTISVRVPAPLKEWLEQRAKRQERSLNYLVTKLIEQAKQQAEAQ